MTDAWRPTPAALARLAAFAPALADPGLRDVEAVTGEHAPLRTPAVTTSDVVDRFQRQAYDDGWIRNDLDWPSWARSDEAVALRDEPAALASATPAQLGRLLTVLIRQERFAEGSLGAAFAAGLVQRIVDRAVRLVADLEDAER